jgi:hypothetical protein
VVWLAYPNTGAVRCWSQGSDQPERVPIPPYTDTIIKCAGLDETSSSNEMRGSTGRPPPYGPATEMNIVSTRLAPYT